MSDIGKPWDGQQGSDAGGRFHTITTDAGVQVYVGEYENGITFRNELDQVWQLPHVQATDDPNVLLIGGVPFRRAPV